MIYNDIDILKISHQVLSNSAGFSTVPKNSFPCHEKEGSACLTRALFAQKHAMIKNDE